MRDARNPCAGPTGTPIGPTLRADLDERDRQIIHMRFVEELTQAQIGERLGVSQMHVSRLLSRCLARLREGLLTAADSRLSALR